ncbi:MAG: chemotaxis protein CheW [Bryobacteraceae bacterium]
MHDEHPADPIFDQPEATETESMEDAFSALLAWDVDLPQPVLSAPAGNQQPPPEPGILPLAEVLAGAEPNAEEGVLDEIPEPDLFLFEDEPAVAEAAAGRAGTDIPEPDEFVFEAAVESAPEPPPAAEPEAETAPAEWTWPRIDADESAAAPAAAQAATQPVTRPATEEPSPSSPWVWPRPAPREDAAATPPAPETETKAQPSAPSPWKWPPRRTARPESGAGTPEAETEQPRRSPAWTWPRPAQGAASSEPAPEASEAPNTQPQWPSPAETEALVTPAATEPAGAMPTEAMPAQVEAAESTPAEVAPGSEQPETDVTGSQPIARDEPAFEEEPVVEGVAASEEVALAAAPSAEAVQEPVAEPAPEAAEDAAGEIAEAAGTSVTVPAEAPRAEAAGDPMVDTAPPIPDAAIREVAIETETPPPADESQVEAAPVEALAEPEQTPVAEETAARTEVVATAPEVAEPKAAEEAEPPAAPALAPALAATELAAHGITTPPEPTAPAQTFLPRRPGESSVWTPSTLKHPAPASPVARTLPRATPAGTIPPAQPGVRSAIPPRVPLTRSVPLQAARDAAEAKPAGRFQHSQVPAPQAQVPAAQIPPPTPAAPPAIGAPQGHDAAALAASAARSAFAERPLSARIAPLTGTRPPEGQTAGTQPPRIAPAPPPAVVAPVAPVEEDRNEPAVPAIPPHPPAGHAVETPAKRQIHPPEAPLEPMTESAITDLIREIDAEVEATPLEVAKPQVQSPQDRRVRTESCIIFALAETRYAFPIGNVLELNTVPRVTAVPQAPVWVRGVANLRGEVISVLDLRSLVGLEEAAEYSPKARILVVRAAGGDQVAALIVDEVRGTAPFSRDTLEQPAGQVSDRVAPLLAGVSEHQDQLLNILDVEKLFQTPEIRGLAG